MTYQEIKAQFESECVPANPIRVLNQERRGFPVLAHSLPPSADNRQGVMHT